MVDDWLLTSWGEVAMVAVSATGIFITTIVLTRLNGLRSFAKMSAFDFATTVAMGTVLASTLATQDPPLAQGAASLVALFVLQQIVARLRRGSSRFQRIIENEPILLMRDGEYLEENMRSARITRDDVRRQLRSANVLSVRNVRAVVLESTGDVSVLHSAEHTVTVDDHILADVRGYPSR